MRKSTLFLSAALTTFVMAVLVGAVSAYQGVIRSSTLQTSQPATTPTDVSVISDPSNSSQVSNPTGALNPQQAAALAAQLTGQQDLYSIESASVNGADAYKVTFSSGNVVYMSPEGQILSVVLATATTAPAPNNSFATIPSTPKPHHDGGGSSGGSSSSGGGYHGDDGGGDH